MLGMGGGKKSKKQKKQNSGMSFCGGANVYVKQISGQTLTIYVDEYWAVSDLKYEIMNQTGIPSEMQRVMFSGQPLDDSYCLQDYGISPEATLHLIQAGATGGAAEVHSAADKMAGNAGTAAIEEETHGDLFKIKADDRWNVVWINRVDNSMDQ